MNRLLVSLTFVLATLAEASPQKEIEQTLDQFHQAASKADATTYFGLFAPEGVFLGTDATERWTVEEFRKYAMPHFSKGKGWTYVATRRSVELAPGGELAWFDELLDNKSYGTCRGSGVLRRIDGRWKISQYHLTIPVPNELAEKVVKMIRETSTGPSAKTRSR
jgi:ketosteroid isomerase-like protein